MHNLTPLSELSITGLLPYLLLTSLVIFVFMMVVMIFFYGLSIADIHRKIRIILRNFFFISAFVSLLVLGYFYYCYNSAYIYKIYDIEKNKTDHKVWLDFKTSQALFTYIEYNNFEKGIYEEILPLNGPGKKTKHSFIISTGKQGGKVYIVINSKKFLVDGKPIMIE